MITLILWLAGYDGHPDRQEREFTFPDKETAREFVENFPLPNDDYFFAEKKD